MSRSTDLLAGMLALTLCVTGGSAAARESDRNQPMDIKATSQDCSLGKTVTCTFTGNVLITQGSLRITAAKAFVQQNNGSPDQAKFSGGATLHQELDDGSVIDASAANIDYDLRHDIITLTGKAKIRQPRGSLDAERVVYNMKTGQIQSGGDGSGRIQMRILPRNTSAATEEAS